MVDQHGHDRHHPQTGGTPDLGFELALATGKPTCCVSSGGRFNQDFAAVIFVTVNTVKSCIPMAYRKIGVTSHAPAVRWALVHRERG